MINIEVSKGMYLKDYSKLEKELLKTASKLLGTEVKSIEHLPLVINSKGKENFASNVAKRLHTAVSSPINVEQKASYEAALSEYFNIPIWKKMFSNITPPNSSDYVNGLVDAEVHKVFCDILLSMQIHPHRVDISQVPTKHVEDSPHAVLVTQRFTAYCADGSLESVKLRHKLTLSATCHDNNAPFAEHCPYGFELLDVASCLADLKLPDIIKQKQSRLLLDSDHCRLLSSVQHQITTLGHVANQID